MPLAELRRKRESNSEAYAIRCLTAELPASAQVFVIIRRVKSDKYLIDL